MTGENMLEFLKTIRPGFFCINKGHRSLLLPQAVRPEIAQYAVPFLCALGIFDNYSKLGMEKEI